MKRTGGRCGTRGYGAHPETDGEYGAGRETRERRRPDAGKIKCGAGGKRRKRAAARRAGEAGACAGRDGKIAAEKPPPVRTVISVSDERRRLKIHYRSA